jgi:hypothetical protein
VNSSLGVASAVGSRGWEDGMACLPAKLDDSQTIAMRARRREPGVSAQTILDALLPQ